MSESYINTGSNVYLEVLFITLLLLNLILLVKHGSHTFYYNLLFDREIKVYLVSPKNI